MLPGIKALKPSDYLYCLISENSNEDDVISSEAWWQTLRKHWQEQLNKLGSEFRKGVAYNNPLNCQYCLYPGLCRKHDMELET